MPTTRFTVHTSLSPSEVMTLLTDFGPDRASRWPNIDEAHFAVHDQGETGPRSPRATRWAGSVSATPGTPTAGTVTVDTLESNLWAPQSRWHYELAPATAGTDVHVTLTRVPKSFRGRIIAALIPIVGARTLGRQFESVLRHAESR